jgi:hypothetical protein
MNTSRSVLSGLYGLLALALLAAPLQADEKIKSRMVDCDKGQDPAQVLDRELGPQRLEMTLVGTCPGFSVSRDDVRIEGDDENGCPATTASVDGTIRFDSAQRAVIACLTVTGSGNGIQAAPGSSIQIFNSSISGNAGVGVFVTSSSIQIFNSSISGNANAGVFANSTASIGLTGSQVMNNGGSGIEIYTNTSADIDNSQVTGNGTSGGAADLYLFLQSVATGQGNTIGATNLRLDSAILLDGPSIGPVDCEDTKSSALVNGAVPAECMDY